MSNSDDPVFAALADPTRRKILERLDGAESPTATEFASRLPITRQAVTKHLKELERAGLISSVKAGRETRSSATDDGLETAAIWLAARGVTWDERLARLIDLATGGSDR
jgi:DNA-binding transcriptional ArsR family regulator